MAHSKTIERKTTDLLPGDVILFADLEDHVIMTERREGTADMVSLNPVIRVDVVRNGRETFFYAGREAVHTVRRVYF